MLTRAARHRTSAPCYDTGCLRFRTCDALRNFTLLRYTARRCDGVARYLLLRQAAHRNTSLLSVRGMATAVEPLPPMSADHVPFEGLSLSDSETRLKEFAPRSSIANVRAFNPRNLVIVPQLSYTQPPRFHAVTRTAMSGDVAELQQSLYACVQVGRLDRAAVLARRLSHLFVSTAPEVFDAHSRYMCGMLESLLRAPSRDKFTAMQRWLELEIRARSVPIDSSIVAVMIKGSFCVLDGTRLERTLRRYFRYAQDLGPTVEQETLSSEMFTEAEWCRLIRLMPQRFSAPLEHVPAPEPLPESRLEDSGPPSTDPHIHGSLGTTADSSPDVKETDLKGHGLKSVRRALVSLTSHAKEALTSFESEESATRIRQERLETDVIEAALEKWQEDSDSAQRTRTQGALGQPLFGAHAHEWVQKMVELLRLRLKRAEALETSSDILLHETDLVAVAPFLKFAKPEVICACAILTHLNCAFTPILRRAGFSDAVPVRKLSSEIGQSLLREMKADQIRTHLLQRSSRLFSNKRRQEILRIIRRTSPGRLMGTTSTAVPAVDGLSTEQDWEPLQAITPSLTFKLGAVMLSMILDAAKLPTIVGRDEKGDSVVQNLSIGAHEYQWRNGVRIGVIVAHPELVQRLKKVPPADLIAKPLPMIAEPKKWQGLTDGAYLKTSTCAVRTSDSSRSQLQYLRLADQRGDLRQMYAGLDVISKVPWRVNRALFNVMVDVWNTGEGIVKLAPASPVVSYPPEPDKADRTAYARWRNKVKNVENEITGWHSQRVYQNFQLEVARAFLDDEFYCPHNVDFRGRAYPIPPYFNHMGADYIRGLFQFAKGKELGEVGLYWLKIHLANVYGYDKESLGEREAFVNGHISEIYDSAENPLTGKRWWMAAEDPWQCLAACMELRGALDSPVPSRFISHLPVQQDGSCNGLQHYAALGGDEMGAKQVNLAPGDKPADIYSAVADAVKQRVAEDARKDEPYAKILDGHIVRKVVKQPVMTNVYGVTYVGAAAQVRKQLQDIIPKESLSDDIHLGSLSKYVARLIFEALAQMFSGAHAIQQWLGECGGRISQAVTPEQIERLRQRRNGKSVQRSTAASATLAKSEEQRLATEDYQFKSTIVWTTPLGLPVVQPYRQSKCRSIQTNLQRLTIVEPSVSDPVSKRKQLQGFPPNFIHSLDATHMMLSALKCDEIGLTFAAVHDSFWTHAGDIPVLNRVLRDSFVRMHCEDIIGRLREEFIARYKGCLNWRAIQRYSDVGRKIEAFLKTKTSKSHFLMGQIRHRAQVDALMEEDERQRLLKSDDPNELEKGRSMVTPYSIYEAEAGDADEQFLSGNNMSAFAAKPQGPDAAVEPPHQSASLDEESVVAEPFNEEADELRVADDAEDLSTAEHHDPEGKRLAVEDQHDSETADPTAKKPRVKNDRLRSAKIYLWMPLTFPEPPARGTFDVARLKDSQYFFS